MVTKPPPKIIGDVLRRVLEAVLIALITGAFTAYLTLAKLDLQQANFKEQLIDVKIQIQESNRYNDTKLEAMQQEIVNHIQLDATHRESQK